MCKVSACVSKHLLLVDLLEDVFEATVILLEDGVFGAEVKRPPFGQTHLEGAVGKVPDGLVCVVHSQGHTTRAWSHTFTYIHQVCNNSSYRYRVLSVVCTQVYL